MERPNRSWIGEVLGGVSLVGLLLGGISYGETRHAVNDHVDPVKHQGIVLAGNMATAEKIVRIEGDVEHLKEQATANGEKLETVGTQVEGVRSDLRLLLELNRRAIDGPRRPAAASSPPAPLAPAPPPEDD